MCAPWAAWMIPVRPTAWMSTSRPESLNNSQLGATIANRIEKLMRKSFAATLLLLAAVHPAAAGTESIGTDVAIALPLIAGGITLYKDDWKGSAQLTADTVATVGLAYGLKHVIREQRPDKSDFH